MVSFHKTVAATCDLSSNNKSVRCNGISLSCLLLHSITINAIKTGRGKQYFASNYPVSLTKGALNLQVMEIEGNVCRGFCK